MNVAGGDTQVVQVAVDDRMPEQFEVAVFLILNCKHRNLHFLIRNFRVFITKNNEFQTRMAMRRN